MLVAYGVMWNNFNQIGRNHRFFISSREKSLLSFLGGARIPPRPKNQLFLSLSNRVSQGSFDRVSGLFKSLHTALETTSSNNPIIGGKITRQPRSILAHFTASSLLMKRGYFLSKLGVKSRKNGEMSHLQGNKGKFSPRSRNAYFLQSFSVCRSSLGDAGGSYKGQQSDSVRAIDCRSFEEVKAFPKSAPNPHDIDSSFDKLISTFFRLYNHDEFRFLENVESEALEALNNSISVCAPPSSLSEETNSIEDSKSSSCLLGDALPSENHLKTSLGDWEKVEEIGRNDALASSSQLDSHEFSSEKPTKTHVSSSKNVCVTSTDSMSKEHLNVITAEIIATTKILARQSSHEGENLQASLSSNSSLHYQNTFTTSQIIQNKLSSPSFSSDSGSSPIILLNRVIPGDLSSVNFFEIIGLRLLRKFSYKKRWENSTRALLPRIIRNMNIQSRGRDNNISWLDISISNESLREHPRGTKFGPRIETRGADNMTSERAEGMDFVGSKYEGENTDVPHISVARGGEEGKKNAAIKLENKGAYYMKRPAIADLQILSNREILPEKYALPLKNSHEARKAASEDLYTCSSGNKLKVTSAYSYTLSNALAAIYSTARNDLLKVDESWGSSLRSLGFSQIVKPSESFSAATMVYPLVPFMPPSSSAAYCAYSSRFSPSHTSSGVLHRLFAFPERTHTDIYDPPSSAGASVITLTSQKKRSPLLHNQVAIQPFASPFSPLSSSLAYSYSPVIFCFPFDRTNAHTTRVILETLASFIRSENLSTFSTNEVLSIVSLCSSAIQSSAGLAAKLLQLCLPRLTKLMVEGKLHLCSSDQLTLLSIYKALLGCIRNDAQLKGLEEAYTRLEEAVCADFSEWPQSGLGGRIEYQEKHTQPKEGGIEMKSTTKKGNNLFPQGGYFTSKYEKDNTLFKSNLKAELTNELLLSHPKSLPSTDDDTGETHMISSPEKTVKMLPTSSSGDTQNSIFSVENPPLSTSSSKLPLDHSNDDKTRLRQPAEDDSLRGNEDLMRRDAKSNLNQEELGYLKHSSSYLNGLESWNESLAQLFFVKAAIDEQRTNLIEFFGDCVCGSLPSFSPAQITTLVWSICLNEVIDEFWLYMMAKHIEKNVEIFSPSQLASITACYAFSKLEDEDFCDKIASHVLNTCAEEDEFAPPTLLLPVFLDSFAKVRYCSDEMNEFAFSRLESAANARSRRVSHLVGGEPLETHERSLLEDLQSNLFQLSKLLDIPVTRASSTFLGIILSAAANLDYRAISLDGVWNALLNCFEQPSGIDARTTDWLPFAIVWLLPLNCIGRILDLWLDFFVSYVSRCGKGEANYLQRRVRLLINSYDLGLLPKYVISEQHATVLKEFKTKKVKSQKNERLYTPESSAFHLEVSRSLIGLGIAHKKEISIADFLVDITLNKSDFVPSNHSTVHEAQLSRGGPRGKVRGSEGFSDSSWEGSSNVVTRSSDSFPASDAYGGFTNTNRYEVWKYIKDVYTYIPPK